MASALKFALNVLGLAQEESGNPAASLKVIGAGCKLLDKMTCHNQSRHKECRRGTTN